MVADAFHGIGGDHRGEGVWDFERHLRLLRFGTGADAVHLLHAGPDMFTELSPQDRLQSGKRWTRATGGQTNWRSERSETVASIRHLSEPVRVGSEKLAGQRLRRYSLRVRPDPAATDPLLKGVHEHVRSEGIKQLRFDAWLTGDDRLWQTREHATLHRAHARRTGVRTYSLYCWEFGIDLGDLAAPSPDEILL
nr:hypothetical protein GCM10010200_094980 [Actinomadura rugatobispora]